MSTKTNSLTAGPTLDALVALAQGWYRIKSGGEWWDDRVPQPFKVYVKSYQPSTNGMQAFELIEKFKIDVLWEDDKWGAFSDCDATGTNYMASTPAEAICKAVVASKWGYIIPDDIMEQVNGLC